MNNTHLVLRMMGRGIRYCPYFWSGQKCGHRQQSFHQDQKNRNDGLCLVI